MEKLHKLKEVKALTGLPATSIRRQIEKGTFPRPVKTGPRTVAWRDSDLVRWAESLSSPTREG